MGISRRDGYWLWVGGPVPKGAAATTVGSLVIVRRRHAEDRHLLDHELQHVAQWRRFGLVGFLVRYLRGYLRGRLQRYPHWAAYRRIPFEVEAEWQARLLRSERNNST